MKRIFTILLVLSTLVSTAQCDPDKNFLPSATIELTTDWGFIAQAGITGQISRLSLHAGLRVRTMVDSIGKLNKPEEKMLPRGEIDLRIINGLHTGVGISEDPDVYVQAYARVGEAIAISGRLLYDGAFVFGIGAKFLFNAKQ